MSATSPEDLKDILDFVKESDGTFLSSHCEIKPSKLGGLGVFSTKDIHEGSVLLRVPKSSIFSSSNSAVANLLLDEEIDGMLALNIAFIYETTVFRSTSHWYKYLKSIKYEDNEGTLYLPPSMWDAKVKKWLKDTTFDALHDALSPQDELQEGFEIAINLALKWGNDFGLEIPKGFLDVDIEDEKDVKLKYSRFVATAFAISSRVFEIDNYHESALVPVADLFNHHVSTPNVRFISLYEVCYKCGEPGMCKHLIAEEVIEEQKKEKSMEIIENPSQDSIVDTELIQCLENGDFDEEDNSMSENENNDSQDEDDNVTEAANDIYGNKIDPEDCVELAVVVPISEGEEIFNSYGEMPNSYLMARYGFCVRENPSDLLYLGKQLISLAAKDRKIHERLDFWKNTIYEPFIEWYQLERKESEEDDDHEISDCKDHDHSTPASAEESDEYSDNDEENDIEESVKPWLSEICLDCEGEPTISLTALSNLISMKNTVYKNFVKKIESSKEEDNGRKIYQTLISTRSNKDVNTFVRALLKDVRIFKLPKSKDELPKDVQVSVFESLLSILAAENRMIEIAKNKYL
ncbi:hypothetical protein TBLA_0G02900 [Henningerozyma blattae CBS 6284]|uniref:SET domain-containing protein n=1 Tax=Henningerozyma blattae (strain ATCC 34711 / CBS 6284 / DSM 70876 / NBRC 10599 / NRRL Y-10934 / UCD 77-7) TaxID=1071380 RepID=I2H775_HENB6|nr:hypothetical protein TBLA_0G02900 [Tetrapisispora blattae CBS 6284]CCH62227.1 hypothetical protein TBLA_0G02900 [Tetrapisispora blattae CBS 6284]